jgi:integrase
MGLTPANFEGDVVILQRLKRGRLTRQALAPAIKDELLELVRSVRAKSPNARLFPHDRRTLWRAIQAAGHRAGVDQKFLHPHSLRHRVGRRGAERGRTSLELMAYLGHRSSAVSMMYTEIACNPELSKRFF